MDSPQTFGIDAHDIRCVACGSRQLERRTALVSPFISEYALQKPAIFSAIMEC